MVLVDRQKEPSGDAENYLHFANPPRPASGNGVRSSPTDYILGCRDLGRLLNFADNLKEALNTPVVASSSSQ
jgi:hypothetical protein